MNFRTPGKTKKKHLENGSTVFLATMFFLGSAGGLCAQGEEKDGGVDQLKQAVLKRFDANLDGNLSAGEQAKAVSFLNEVDKNGDGEISLSERTVAMGALQRMGDPAKTRATEKQTLENRNESKRATKWNDYLRSLPHGAGARTFTTNKMPGEPGFDVKGEKEVDITEVKGGLSRDIPKAMTYEELKMHREKRNAANKSKRAAEDRGGTKPRVVADEGAVAAASKARNKSYYDGTLILAKDKVHTVVPKGAILNLPSEMEGMLVEKPEGDLMRWPDFLKKYGKFVTTREVSWATVKGEDPIKENEKKAFAKGGKVVIAVFRGGPVTVLEPPPEEEGAVGAVVSDSGKKK